MAAFSGYPARLSPSGGLAGPVEVRIAAGKWDYPIHHRNREQDRMAKTALITGISGQDGSYLAELLLDKGYDVVGMVRRTSSSNGREHPTATTAQVGRRTANSGLTALLWHH